MAVPKSLGCVVACSFTILISVILLITSSVYIDQTYYLRDLWTQIYTLSIFSLVISILAIIFAGVLIYVVLRQLPALTSIFAGSVALIAFLSLTCGILLSTGRHNVIGFTYKDTVRLFADYSVTSPLVGSIQQEFHCCGLDKATYWEYSFPGNTSTPDSCCFYVTPHCGQGALLTQDKIYLRGCAEPMANDLQNKYNSLITLNFLLLVASLATTILGLYFERHIREQYQTM